LVLADGGQQPTVRAERHHCDSAGAGEGYPDGVAAGRIPQLQLAECIGGGKQVAVLSERHRRNLAIAREAHADGVAAAWIP
jgi:hypothetical protein